jgi:CheY-like chemotaxis protein
VPDAHARADADADAAPVPDAARPALLRILIADDNQDAAELLAQSLQLAGHAVTTVHDGRAALDAIAAQQPDLALLDIGMPGMDGHQLAEAIRRDPGLRHTVLAAITGWGSGEDRERSHRAGFDHHLTKPVDLDSIMAIAAAIRPARQDQPS